MPNSLSASITRHNDEYQNSKNKLPPWILAPFEEKELREICQKQADEMCKDVMIMFGKCSEKHQLTFPWKCTEQKKAMIDCVAHWGSWEIYEEERSKYIAAKQIKQENYKQENNK